MYDESKRNSYIKRKKKRKSEVNQRQVLNLKLKDSKN